MSCYVMAIDPGPVESAYVIYDYIDCIVEVNDHVDNVTLLERVEEFISNYAYPSVAVEMISSYGMPVGKTTFETCLIIGRIQQIVPEKDFVLLARADIKYCICGTRAAKDANIRQSCLDWFKLTGKDGKGNPSAIGTKANPGPLFGISKHKWSALAVAVAFERNCKKYVLLKDEVE